MHNLNAGSKYCTSDLADVSSDEKDRKKYREPAFSCNTFHSCAGPVLSQW